MKSKVVPYDPYIDRRAANFNGTDEYAYVDDPSFKADTAGAFLFRVRLATLLGANGQKGVFGYGTTSAGNDSHIRFRQIRSAATSNQNRWQVAENAAHGGTVNAATGGTALAATTTYGIVVQSNGTAYSIYHNAVAETLTLSGSNTGNWMGDISGSNHRLTFGTAWRSNAILTYDDCRLNECIYVGGRAMTGAEITEWYNAGVPKDPRSLSFKQDIDGFWRFGDIGDTGSIIHDHVGSNNLTTVNMDSSNYGTP